MEMEMECDGCEGIEYQYQITDFDEFVREHGKCFGKDETPSFTLKIIDYHGNKAVGKTH